MTDNNRSMNKSYLGFIEYKGKTFHKFFTGKVNDPNALVKSKKAMGECEAWVSAILKEYGTTNVRVSISEVLWTISG